MKLQTTDFRFVAKLDKHDHYTDANGVIRWASNNSVPPIDILELAFVDGKISEQTLQISLDTKKAEDNAFIESYIQMRQKHGYSEEELFEMEASFGSNETIVDIFTGQTIKVGA
jgi:hypothetical protein